MNRRDNVLNRIEGKLNSRIAYEMIHGLRKELDQVCNEVQSELKQKYPDLQEFIYSVKFDVKVKVCGSKDL